MRIIVIAEHLEQAQSLVNAANALGAPTEIITTSDEVCSAVLADSIYEITVPETYSFEDSAATIAEFLSQEKPEYVFFGVTKSMRLLAGKIAARLGAAVLADIMSLSEDGSVEHLVYGGAAIRTERSNTKMTLLMVPTGVIPEKSVQGARQIRKLEFIAPRQRPLLKKTEQREKTSVNLGGASRVVGVGRGIVEESDLTMIETLAKALDAHIGCTRPIAEEEKWLPRETYIGVSGIMIAPDVYIALGLSGQVQHTVGVSRAKKIVAINKEKNAPIFKQADLGIVSDLYKIVPILTESLQKS